MPQFFFNHEHLDAKQEAFPIHDVEGQPILDAQKNPKLLTDLDYTKRFENIEIRALSQFLLANSKPFEYIGQPKGITELPSTERGKWQFETRGWLPSNRGGDAVWSSQKYSIRIYETTLDGTDFAPARFVVEIDQALAQRTVECLRHDQDRRTAFPVVVRQQRCQRRADMGGKEAGIVQRYDVNDLQCRAEDERHRLHRRI